MVGKVYYGQIFLDNVLKVEIANGGEIASKI